MYVEAELLSDELSTIGTDYHSTIIYTQLLPAGYQRI
jgi:hypothetical protein